jgi:hypothetical protein
MNNTKTNRPERKDFNNKGGKKPAKKFTPNPEMKIPMYLGANVGKYQYSLDELVELLKSVPWEKISYPVLVARSAIFDDVQKDGTIQVGYIKSVEYIPSHDAEQDIDYTDVMFNVSIYPKNEEKIKAIDAPIMFPKLRLSRGSDIEHIIGFQIMTSNLPDDEWDNIK